MIALIVIGGSIASIAAIGLVLRWLIRDPTMRIDEEQCAPEAEADRRRTIGNTDFET